MLKKATAGTGKPKESYIWNYFKYLEEKNKSVCLVIKHNGEEKSVVGYLIKNFQPI